jgi:hypothetical protein
MMILAFLSRIMVADLATISKENDRAVQLEFPGGSPDTAPARPTASYQQAAASSALRTAIYSSSRSFRAQQTF